jgi:hypothetical protein
MSGSDEDLGKMTDSEKLDRILGQLATMNNRLDAHAQNLFNRQDRRWRHLWPR